MRRQICLLALVALLTLPLLSAVAQRSASATCAVITITSSPFALVGSNGPKVATLSARIQNTSAAPLRNITVYLGNGTTAGEFALQSGQGLQTLGPASDAARPLGDLPPGVTKTLYWHVRYPNTPDLSYSYTVWATSDNGCAPSQSATLQIKSASAASSNKILPLDGSVIIEPTTGQIGIGQLVTVTIMGFDLGAVGAGPEAVEDAWFQPASNANFDPTCLRLISTEVALKSISSAPYAEQIYFTGIGSHNPPPNYSRNTSDYVRYTFIGLRNCSTTLQPYQQVASGSGHTFNADIGTITLNIHVSESLGKLVLDKSVSPTTTIPGTVLTYTIEYGNTGEAAMGNPTSGNGVIITDQLPPTLTYVTGSSQCSKNCLKLWSTDGGATFVATEPAAAASVTALRWLILDPIPPGHNPAGTVGFQATATSSDELCNPAQGSIGTTAIITSDIACVNSSADIQITQSGPATALPGGALTYTISYRNNGPSVAEDVVITDTLPTGTQFVRASPPPTSNSGSQLTFMIGSLPPDHSGSINVQVSVLNTINTGTVLTNIVQATTASAETNTANNSASFNTTIGTGNQAPTVNATMTASLVADSTPLGASPGDVIEYTVTITNAGSGPVTGVTFSLTPDPNTVLIEDSITTSKGTVHTQQSQVQIDVGSLAHNASVTVQFRVQIKNSLPQGITSIRAQGLVFSHERPAEPTDDPKTLAPHDPTEIFLSTAPLLRVHKTYSIFNDLDGNGQPSPGDILKYTLTITNVGRENVGSVVLSDGLDSHVTLVIGSVTTTQGAVLSGNNETDRFVQVNLGTLTANSNATITFRVGVNTQLPSGVAAISNHALVSAENIPSFASDDPTTRSTDDPTVTVVIEQPYVLAFMRAFLKEDNDQDGLPSPGDTLSYHVEIINIGNADATNVFFSNTPDRNTGLVVGSVRTSEGTVMTGNTIGDTSVGVLLDRVPRAGGAAQISFDVAIKDPTSAPTIVNHALVNIPGVGSIPSDDPDTSAQGDPTVTVITAAPWVHFTKDVFLVYDTDRSGAISPGDILEYLLTLMNTGSRDAADIAISDTPDLSTRFLVNTIKTSQGAIGSSGASSTASVGVGVLGAAGGRARVSFRVQINNPVPPQIRTLSNQAQISGSNISVQYSDDPHTLTLNDATVTLLSSSFLLCGDVDNNGVVEDNDARLAARAVLGTVQLTESQQAAADVAPPFGTLDMRDVILISEVARGYRAYCPPLDARAAATSTTPLRAHVPLHLESIQYQRTDRAIRFRVQGTGIAEFRVHVFSLAGRAIFTSDWHNSLELEWHRLADNGSPVANGVYLYVITARGADGALLRSRVQKLVILR